MFFDYSLCEKELRFSRVSNVCLVYLVEGFSLLGTGSVFNLELY